MSVGALGGLVGSAAGAPLSQTAGSEPERTQRDSTTHERTINATEKAEMAAGIGTTEQDQGTDERDADGRRLWRLPPDKKRTAMPTPSGKAKTPRAKAAHNLI